jgi:hypothetical protein
VIYIRSMDWQSVMVALSVLAALTFVGRRGWTRLQSVLRTKVDLGSSCASACGGCASQKRVLDQKHQILSYKKSSR